MSTRSTSIASRLFLASCFLFTFWCYGAARLAERWRYWQGLAAPRLGAISPFGAVSRSSIHHPIEMPGCDFTANDPSPPPGLGSGMGLLLGLLLILGFVLLLAIFA